MAVGKGAHREAFRLVATPPHSAAHAAVFTFERAVAGLLPAALECLQRLDLELTEIVYTSGPPRGRGIRDREGARPGGRRDGWRSSVTPRR